MRSVNRTLCGLAVLITPVIAMTARPPVEDFSANRSAYSLPRTVNILSRRLDNYDQQHLGDKLLLLQHQLEKMQGQLAVQAHALSRLRTQQQQFNQQMTQRLTAMNRLPKPVAAQQYQAASPLSASSGPSQASATTASIATAHSDVKVYRAAFAYLGQKKYAAAIEGFTRFKRLYPKSTYVASANYWMAQIYQLQGRGKQAENLYRVIVRQYPRSNKVAGSLYKLAGMARQRGDTNQAKKYLNQIIQQFPQQAIASIARRQLNALSQTTGSSLRA